MPISSGAGSPGDSAATGFADIAGYVGVDNTGATECAAAINTALTTIAAAGQRAYARGTFKIASTVTISCDADFTDATFSYTPGSGTAVRVGSATLGTTVYRLDVRLPAVTAAAKPDAGTGWAAVAGTIGVDLSNLHYSFVRVPHVKHFETGLRCYGTGAGFAYNFVEIGMLDNCKVSQKLTADATGYCNENTFVVGAYYHASSEGTNVSGTRQLVTDVCTNNINNNLFLKPCFEGNVPEYHALIGGSYNRLFQGRFEASTPKVRWDSDAIANVVDGGYASGNIVESFVSGASGSNDLRTHLRDNLARIGGTTGTLILENLSSSAYPADVVMEAGARLAGSAPATAYAVARSADATKMKRGTDANARILFDHENGRIYQDQGTADPTAGGYLTGTATQFIVNSKHLLFNVDNTWDVGSSSNKPRDLYVGRNASIDGALDHNGSTVGFYGTAPVAKQTGVAVSAAAIHAALVNLGLIGA